MTNLIIGYARVSTDDQLIDLQRDALKKAGCERIFEEKKSGKDFDREQLTKALEMLREGDTLVVWRLDRLGRSLKDLIELVSKLDARKIHFRSLTENIDTVSTTGKLIFHIFAAIAEFERNLTRERTYAGLAAARARGRVGGRREKQIDPKQFELARKLYADKEVGVAQICKMMNVSKPTFYKLLKASA